MRRGNASLVSHLLLGGIFYILIHSKCIWAEEEGDTCVFKEIPGPAVCMRESQCEPRIAKYINSGKFTSNQVPSCGLGIREEIVCCPVHECCPEDTSSTTAKPHISKSKELDESSTYFDFQQLLSGKQKPKKEDADRGRGGAISTPHHTHEAIQERPKWEPDRGPAALGTRNREPKIIVNRPPSWPSTWDPIQLVNHRLRQQGMSIEPAREVSSLEEMMHMATTTRSTTSTTTTTMATTTTTDYVDPFAPFRFQAKEHNGLVFGDTTTTTRTINPTPTTRVDVPRERPVVRACNVIQARMEKDSLTTHILEGIPVSPGVYPHMAAIAFSNFGSNQFRCGGSLISARFVLTAAHCVNEDTPVFVRLGSVNLETPSAGFQDIPISNITIHHDYVSSSKYNDIAILELAVEPTLGDNIYPACLETNASDPPATASLFVAGWGVMNQTTRAQSKILLRAALENVALAQCNSLFDEQPSSRKALKQGVIDSLLCAADKRRQKADACQGDSGGPLIFERNLTDGNYTIIGIISSGFGCATKTPGLYTRVASYLDFIESVVWPENRSRTNDL